MTESREATQGPSDQSRAERTATATADPAAQEPTIDMQTMARAIETISARVTHLSGVTEQVINNLGGQVQQAQAQAARADAIGTTAMARPTAPIRIPQPQRFKGVRDGPKVLEWAHQATVYLRAAGLENSEQGVWHISNFFEGDAAVWWRLYSNKMERGLAPAVASWSDLKTILVEQFQVFNHITDVRDQYTALRQIGTVSAYINRFRSLVVEIPDEPEEHQIYQFLKGLKPEIQARTRTHKPATLAMAMDIADEADRANYHAYRGTRDTRSGIGLRPLMRPQRAEPMQIGAISRGAYQKAETLPKAFMGAVGPTQRRSGPRMTPVEMARMQAENRCFNCGQQGHRAAACKRRPADRGAKRTGRTRFQRRPAPEN